MDYLVNLSLVGPEPALVARLEAAGITIRRALAPELELATDWVRRIFGPGWAGETAVAFSRQPPSCFLATQGGRLIGFSCHEATARGFFGPTGVEEAARGRGIGHALLVASLLDLKAMGYAYAIIGDVGPSAFYERTVGAMPIPNSEPGIYAGLLKIPDCSLSTRMSRMTTNTRVPFRLETSYVPAANGESLAYALTLTNASASPISDFRLCISGPDRIDPQSEIEGGTLVARLSNHAELAPPGGFALAPGQSWTVTARRMSFPLRHWTDGAAGAYLALADGTTAPVAVRPTRMTGSSVPLKRGTEPYPVAEIAEAPISVIPWPREVAISGRRSAPAGLELHAEAPEAKQAVAAFTALADSLFAVEGIVRPAAEGGFPVSITIANDLPPEAYAIRFAGSGVVVTGSTQAGILYGLITLGQILRGARLHPEAFLFPAAGEIRDEPGVGWRGCHLDVARQFYGSAEIKRFLDILAWNKLNRFHWHLSDDEAWRIEIEAYPQLTEIAAWRGHGLPVPALLGSGPIPSGGYYSKAAVREIVAHAARLGITVVPEIDLPGHCYAMLQALPELRDPGETGQYFSVQGFPNNCLNPAREETYRVLETIFDEMIALFPAKIIHVGADEVPLGAWSGSPAALARLREIGGIALADAHAKRNNMITNLHGADEIDGSGAAALQAAFLKRIQAFLASRGCTTGGWQEAAHGDAIDKTKCYLNGWRSVEICAALAGQGYDVVVNPGPVCYLDIAMSPDWDEPGAGWAGWSSPEKLYSFDPTAGWTEAQKRHFLGVQCCIWSEPMSDRAVFDRLVFPRLSALAENGWTLPPAKSWKRFKGLAGMMPVLYGAP